MDILPNLPFVKKKVVGFVWRRSWASGTVAAVFHIVFDESFDLKNIYLEILSFSMFFVDFHVLLAAHYGPLADG